MIQIPDNIQIFNNHSETNWRAEAWFLGESGNGSVGNNQLEYPKIVLKFSIQFSCLHGFYIILYITLYLIPYVND